MTFATTCGMCRFWQAELRECRRHPPVVAVLPYIDNCDVETRFPNTETDDWCGEWQPVLPPAK